MLTFCDPFLIYFGRCWCSDILSRRKKIEQPCIYFDITREFLKNGRFF
jgi:hypothetical protein